MERVATLSTANLSLQGVFSRRLRVPRLYILRADIHRFDLDFEIGIPARKNAERLPILQSDVFSKGHALERFRLNAITNPARCVRQPLLTKNTTRQI